MDFVGLYPYPWNGVAPLWLSEVHTSVDLVTDATQEPVTLAAAIDQCRALNTDDAAEGGVIDRLRPVVRRQCEFFTRRAIPPQTLKLVLDRFPRERYPPVAGSYGAGAAGFWGAGFGLGVPGLAGTILLPRPPLIAVTSITYYDEGGTEQTLDPSLYQVDASVGPYARHGRVRPVPDQSWPLTQVARLDAVSITFRAGYTNGASPESMKVPEDLIHGQLLMLAELYKSRSESVPAGSSPAQIGAKAIWQPYRVY